MKTIITAIISKHLERRVLREGIVDTKTYRYHLLARKGALYLERCPIGLIGETGCLADDAWQIVKRIK